MALKTGQYDRTYVAGESVESFVPFALPPANPKLVIDEKTQVLLIQAEQKLIRKRDRSFGYAAYLEKLKSGTELE